MIRRLLSLALLLTLCMFAVPHVASAFDPFQQADRGGLDCTADLNASSAVCTDRGSNPDPVSGPNGAIGKVTKIVAMIAGIAAVIVIIVSGLYFITSDGDSNKVASAKNALKNALIGIVIIVVSETLILFILSKL